MQEKESSSDHEHDNVMLWLAHFMTSEYGYKITHMAHSDQAYHWSTIVNGYIPDIIGRKIEDGIVKYAVGEAGSFEGLVSKSAIDKINAFKSCNSQFEFFFGVPSRCLSKAKVLFINILFGENEPDHLCYFDV